MANYTKTNIGNEGRTELHEKLALTAQRSASISSPPAPMSLLSTPTRRMRKSMELLQAREKL